MIGTQIGGYRVVEKLAEGGMGEVFVARHELMQRDAVIKVLLPAMSAHQEMVARFLNEARAVNQIHHAGIVEVFDLGFLPSGQAFIVMERLRGEPLAERLRRGPMSAPQATALARQLASALGAAHAVGIVHRDLKPDNLFLCPDVSVKDPIVDGGERLKILDFGIAKVAQGGGAVKTVAGAVFGTPAYMSPEQCASSGQVDGRSDLYAVGCILYEALCGRPPFGQGGLELIAAHIRDTAPPPRTIAPAIPSWLEDVVVRLLEKDPRRRPQSCAELLAALAPSPSPSAISALPPTIMAAGSSPPPPLVTPSPGPAAAPLPTPWMPAPPISEPPRVARSEPPPSPAPPAAVAPTMTSRPGRRRALVLGVAGFAVVGGVAAAIGLGGGSRGRATPAADAGGPLAGEEPAGSAAITSSSADRPGAPSVATPSRAAVADDGAAWRDAERARYPAQLTASGEGWAWGPDGKTYAYVTDGGSTPGDELTLSIVRPTAAGDPVATHGRTPVFLPDGSGVYFQGPDGLRFLDLRDLHEKVVIGGVRIDEVYLAWSAAPGPARIYFLDLSDMEDASHASVHELIHGETSSRRVAATESLAIVYQGTFPWRSGAVRVREPVTATAPKVVAAGATHRQPKVVASTGRSAEVLAQDARALADHGDLKGALALYRQSAGKGYAAAYKGIGAVKVRLGDPAGAITAFKRYLSLVPGASDAEYVRDAIERLGGTP